MFAYVEQKKKQETKSAVQKKAEEKTTSPQNLTGIPDVMKASFENLSGFSFDDVRVRYNSDKPARLQALAYTQGGSVHLAPGQEKHLGHELGHVIQQKRGRVEPTARLNSVAVNENEILEHEADIMADRAALPSPAVIYQQNSVSPGMNALQMYKVVKSGAKLEATAGRPDVPCTKPFLRAFAGQILAKPYSAQEEQIIRLYAAAKATHAAKIEAIVDALEASYRSTYGAAFCHKLSISEVEETVVDYANTTPRNKIRMQRLLNALTTGYPGFQADALAALDTLTATPDDEDAANDIIRAVNKSPSNYYLGHAPTNSSIGESFDGHYDVFDPGITAPLSPISDEIVKSATALPFHPFLPQIMDGKYAKTSSVGDDPTDGIGWAQVKP